MKKPFIRSVITTITILALSFTAVFAAYTGPGNRTLQTGSNWQRRYCSYTTFTTESGWIGPFLGRWVAPTSNCPGAYVWAQGYQTNGGVDGYSWHCSGWNDYPITWDNAANRCYNMNNYWLVVNSHTHPLGFDYQTYLSACTSGQEGCAIVPEYTTFGPATVDSSIGCDFGTNGWCKGNATLSLWSFEPIPNKAITRFETAAGTLCSGASCDYPVITQGSTSLTYWAVSSFGDTSTQKTSVIKIDSGLPTASLASTGGGALSACGWYTTNIPFVLTTNGADAVSGVGTKKVFVNGASHANPYTLSTEGNFTIYGEVTDLAGNATQTAPITIQRDLTKPTFSLNQSTAMSGSGWFTSPLTLSITGNDAVSGYSHSDYSTGSDTGEMPITLYDGTHTVNLTHYDVAGNNDTSSGTFKIDSTPPTANLSVVGGTLFNGWYNTSTANTLTTTGDDLTSGINTLNVFVDGSSKATPFNLTGDGVFTVYGKAIDVAGNSGQSAPITIQRDNTDPTFTLNQSPTITGSGWFTAPLTLSITGNDSGSGYSHSDYSSTNSTGSTTTGTMPLLLNDGIFTVNMIHYDEAGNDPTSSGTFKVDATPPSANLDVTGGTKHNGWYNSGSSVLLTTTGADLTSGINALNVIVDGSQKASPFNYTSEGVHSIYGKTTDNAGNSTLTSENIVSVDNTNPTVTLNLDKAAASTGWFTSLLTLSVTGNDALSGYDRTDYTATNSKGAITTGTMPLTLNDGSYTLDLKHFDIAGNMVAGTDTYKIDTTKPTVTMFIEGATAIVMIHGKATDETSGIDTASISLDNGLTWNNVTVLASGNWLYLVDATKYKAGTVIPLTLKVTDRAGNTNTQESSTAVDSVAPVATITTQGTSDTINIFGDVTDAGSGVALAEFSFDNGETWSSLEYSEAGSWSKTLDSTLLPDNTTTLLAVRATDRVGNVTLTKAPLTTTNAPVTISLQRNWTLPSAGTLEIKAGYSPIESVVVKICDTTGTLGCTESTYSAENIPTSVSWNGSFGSEQAHAGGYSVLVTVTDQAGRARSAAGMITIESTDEMAVFVETAEIETTEELTQQAPVVYANDIKLSTNPIQQWIEAEVKFKSAPYAILLTFLGVFAANVVVDPRIKQWDRIGKAVKKNNTINIDETKREE